MEKDFLDTLVRLAALGTSGIAIFAIFWIGWLIYKLINQQGHLDENILAALKLYMKICLAIAVVAAASSGLNAYFSGQHVTNLRNEVAAKDEQQTKLAQAVEEKDKELQKNKERTDQLIKHMEIVLKSKEVLADSTGSNPAVKQSIKTLQEMIRAEKTPATVGGGMQ